MSLWPYSGNAGLAGYTPSDDLDDVDMTEPIDFAEAFGVAVEQPSERERALHRTARQRTNAPGQTHHGKDPS